MKKTRFEITYIKDGKIWHDFHYETCTIQTMKRILKARCEKGIYNWDSFKVRIGL